MADLLVGGGGDLPRRQPRLLLALVAVAGLVAVAAWAVTTRPGSGTGAVPAPKAGPGVTPVPTPASGQWAASAGACGSQAFAVVTSARSAGPVPVRLLVGGAGLHLVDGASGRVAAVPGIPVGVEISTFQDGPAALWAFGQAGCSYEQPRAYRLDGPVVLPQPVAAGWASFVAGPHDVWRVQAMQPGGTARTSAVPVTGGPPVLLEPGGFVVADTTPGLVVAVGGESNLPPRLGLLDPSGRRLHDLPTGLPLGTTRSGVVVLTEGGCDPTACTVVAVDAASGRELVRVPLPAGRRPAGSAAVDERARVAVFALMRAEPDPRFPDHPAPPADIAVLDLRTGVLQLVPELLLPPKTSVGLAVEGPTGWVVVTVSQGDHTEVLAWRSGLLAPVVVAEVPGAVTQAAPVRLLPGTPDAQPAASAASTSSRGIPSSSSTASR